MAGLGPPLVGSIRPEDLIAACCPRRASPLSVVTYLTLHSLATSEASTGSSQRVRARPAVHTVPGRRSSSTSSWRWGD